MRFRVFSDRVISKTMDGEAVIINLDTGMYYGLDGPSATVWELVLAGVPITDIAEGLRRQYPATVDPAEDLASLVAKLIDAQLIAPIEARDATPVTFPQGIAWPTTFEPIDIVAYDDVAEMIALDPPLPEFNPSPRGL